MKTTTLSEILSPEQLDAVDQCLKQPDPFNKVRAYLITQRASLEQKGVLPEYLAYAIEYLVTQKKYDKKQ